MSRGGPAQLVLPGTEVHRMFALLLPLVLQCHAAPPTDLAAPCAVGTTTQAGDDKALKALDAWLKLYHSGKMDMRAKNIEQDSIAVKHRAEARALHADLARRSRGDPRSGRQD